MIIPKKEILYAPMLGTLGGGSARGMGRGLGKGRFKGPIGWFAGTNTSGNQASRAVNSSNPMTYIRSRTNDFNVLTTGSSTNATAYDPITHDLWGFDNGTTVQHWEYDDATDTFGDWNSFTTSQNNSAYNHASVWALGGYAGYVKNDGTCNVYKKSGSGTSTSLTYLGTLSGFNTSEESLAQIGYFGIYNCYDYGNLFRLNPTSDYSILNSFSMSSLSGGDGAAWMDIRSSDRAMYSGHNATDQIKMIRWDGSNVTYSTAAASTQHFGNDWFDNHMANKVSLFNPQQQTPNGSYNVGDIYSGYYGWIGCRGYNEVLDKGYGLNGNWQSRSSGAAHAGSVIYCPHHEEWRVLATTVDDNLSGTNKILDITVNPNFAALDVGTATNLPTNRTVYMNNRGTASTSGNYHPASGGIVGA